MVDSSSSGEEPKAAKTCRCVLLPNKLLEGESGFAGQCFPSSIRLCKRSEFLRLSGSDSKFVAKGLLVVWMSNSHPYARLGITVSKRVGCAVVRNKFKRHVREIFRTLRHALPPVDLNVIARRESSSMDCCSLRQELQKVFKYIGASSCSRVSHSS